MLRWLLTASFCHRLMLRFRLRCTAPTNSKEVVVGYLLSSRSSLIFMWSHLSIAHLPNWLSVNLAVLLNLICVEELLPRRNALFVLLSACSCHGRLFLLLSPMKHLSSNFWWPQFDLLIIVVGDTAHVIWVIVLVSAKEIHNLIFIVFRRKEDHLLLSKFFLVFYCRGVILEVHPMNV